MADLSSDRKRGTGRDAGWGWGGVILLGAVILAIWIFAFGTRSYKATPANTQNAQTQQNQPGTAAVPVTPPVSGNTVTIKVHRPNAAQFEGKPARFQNETVQKVVSDKVFWIGPNQNEQMLVVLKDPEAQVKVKQGDRVDVNGVFGKMPDARQARQQWNLTRPVNWLQKQQLYIDATNVVNESNPQATENQ